jgi:hypothetical protein
MREQVKIVWTIMRCLFLRVEIRQLHVCEAIRNPEFRRCRASDCGLSSRLDTLTKIGIDTGEHSCEPSVLAIYHSIDCVPRGNEDLNETATC